MPVAVSSVAGIEPHQHCTDHILLLIEAYRPPRETKLVGSVKRCSGEGHIHAVEDREHFRRDQARRTCCQNEVSELGVFAELPPVSEDSLSLLRGTIRLS